MKRFIFALAAIAVCVVTAFSCVRTVKTQIQPIKTNISSALTAFSLGQREQGTKYVNKAIEHFEKSEKALTLFVGSEATQNLKKDMNILLKLSKQKDKALFSQKAEECLYEITDIEEAQNLSFVNIL